MNDERDESFLIDVLGTWIPECEIIFYGLLNSPYAEEFYKLRENSMFNPRDVYLDHCYFTAKDLVRYLSSVDDTLDDLPEEEINRAVQTALHNYTYVPSSETMIRHSIMEVMYHKFVKSVTLVYPWTPRPIDIMFLKRITPKTIFPKLNVASGSIPAVIHETKQRYTTIISNEIDQISFLVDHMKDYNVDSTLFLLRNHSENMKIQYNQDGSASFLSLKLGEKKEDEAARGTGAGIIGFVGFSVIGGVILVFIDPIIAILAIVSPDATL